MVFVFAANSQQAHNWMRQVGVGVSHAQYIWRPEVLMGQRRGFFICVEGCEKHDHAAEINMLLREREFIEIKVI